MDIPVIDPRNTLDDYQLTHLAETGFCYTPIPAVEPATVIDDCFQLAYDFFHAPPKQKARWALSETFTEGERYQGYTTRSQSELMQSVEQFFFEPDAPYGPFKTKHKEIQTLYATLLENIYTPLLRHLFLAAGADEAACKDAGSDPSLSLVFQYYPSKNNEPGTLRLNAHKDFGLLAILYGDQNALEVKYKNRWLEVPQKAGHVIVNVGNALEKMLGARYRSSLHRVRSIKAERLSMILFINPNQQKPVLNYIDQTKVADSGKQFFDAQFTAYHHETH